MKKYPTLWFAVMLVTIMACFAPGYCDDAPQSPGDSGVTDAVTPRFVKPGKMYEEKKDTAEPVKVEEPKRAPETAAVDNKKKVEDARKARAVKKLKGAQKISNANKAESIKGVRDPKAADNDKQ